MPSYYAVKHGYIPGVYNTWSECQKQVLGYSKPVYKKFKTLVEAQQFIISNIQPNTYKRKEKKNCSNIVENDIINNITLTSDIASINLSQLTDKNGYYYLFTDGSKQKSHTSYGVYLPGCKNSYGSLITNYAEQTNNIAELYAIKTALELILLGYLEGKISKIKTIYIISDSEYSIKAITIWYKKWENNNWKTSTGNDVANLNIIQDIINLHKKITNEQKGKIIFKHQYAHKSSPNASNISLEYYLWQGNYIIDHLVQKTIINQ